jgi:hypothetical protein
MADNMLASAKRVWQQAASDFDPSLAEVDGIEMYEAESSNMLLSLKRISNWLDHAITKFGACAAVADANDVKGLEPVAAEVVKAFVAAIGTMISLRRGAGPTLCMELHTIGNELATTIEQLGASVGTASMALAAGKALDRAQRLEHLSISNRFAIAKRLDAIRTQLCNCHDELTDALTPADIDDEQDNEDSLEEFDCDCSLDADERSVAMATDVAVDLFKNLLDAIMRSHDCGNSQGEVDLVRIDCGEVVVSRCAVAVDSIDGLVAHVLGGLNRKEFLQSLAEFQQSLVELGRRGLDTQKLQESVLGVHSALANV